MSAWHLAVKALYELGGKASTNQVFLRGANGRALQVAKHLGLVEHGPDWRGRGKAVPWWLTPRGLDLCEGRLVRSRLRRIGRHGRPPIRFHATWLMSLPRDIRIEQRGSV